jgi:hypothetical protein
MEDAASGSTQEHHIGSSLQPSLHGDLSCRKRRSTFDAGATILQSQQPPVTLGSLEGLGAQNRSFRNFRARLAAWLTLMMPVYGFSFAPDHTRVELQANDKVGFASDMIF